MAYRPHFGKLITIAVVSGLTLTACGPTSTQDATRTEAEQVDYEALLRQQAEIMQKTILEGAVAGGFAGGGLGRLLGGDDKDVQRGIRLGAAAGAAAGTYVAHIQRKYFLRSKRLEAIKEDLDKNAIEMQTTINVMQGVLAVQRDELNALRARAAAGEAVDDALAAEVEQANANLAEMEKAIEGAVGRQGEFGEARGLTLARNDTVSDIDPDLAALAAQIDTMKLIAQDLSASLGEA